MEAKIHTYTQIAIDKVKELSFNRNKVENHIKALSRSVTKIGVLRTPVVAKTKAVTGSMEYYIIDGQHLIESLKRLNIPKVNVILVETESVREIVDMMALLNNVQQKWTLSNYTDAYIGMGNIEYFKLKEHSVKTGFSLSLCSYILSGSRNAGYGKTTSIRSGNFKVAATDANELTQYLQDVCSIVGHNHVKFQLAFCDFFRANSKNYDHEQFKKKLNKKLDEFVDIPHDTGYCYALLNRVWNNK
jgi:hypothetical protein